MASVSCTYTYKPTSDGTEIFNSPECADNRNTFIVVPQAATSDQFRYCGTTIVIKYKIKNPPPGGVTITRGILDFTYNLTAQGRVGTTYANSTVFPNTGAALMGTYEYVIPDITNHTSGTVSITFWPDSINSTIVISYVSLRLQYTSNESDTTIPAPLNVAVYPNYYNRVAVRWTAPPDVQNIDHYSVGIFGGSHDPNSLTVMTSELVSDGWQDTPDNRTSTFVLLDKTTFDKSHPETTPAVFAQVCVVTTDRKVGAVATSLISPSSRYATFFTGYIDTLEDENEYMYTLGSFSTAYRLCKNMISFLNPANPSAADIFMPYNNWDADDRIPQSVYEDLAKQVGIESNEPDGLIPDDMNILTPMTHAQWAAILDRL